MRNYYAKLASERFFALTTKPVNVTETISESSQTNNYNVPERFDEFASLCRIRSGKNVIPFKLYDYQVQLGELIDNYRGVIVFKTRQLGITETVACKFLHKAILNPAYVAGMLSMGQEESSNVARRIRKMPAAIPGFQFATNNLKDLEIKNGGRVVFRPSTDNAIRSLESVSDLMFDESAFVPNAEEIYSSAVPTQEMVGDSARTVIVSTMSNDGKLSWFWQMFNSNNGNIDAERMCHLVKDNEIDPFQFWVDETGWAKVIIHWKSHPVYVSIPGYLEKIKSEKKLSEDKVQREYNLGIPVSGASLFNVQLINQYAKGMWKRYEKGHHYLIGIDPNFGGNDYFTALVWDVTQKPYELIYQYRNNEHGVTYHQDQILTIIDHFNPIAVAIEANSGGVIILENLIKVRPQIRFEGIKTTSVSKIVNTDRLAISLEQGDVIYPPHWHGMGEMELFLSKDRRAATGHDDCIMAWASAWTLIDEVEAKRTATISFNKAWG